MTNIASRVTDDNWIERFEAADTDEQVMGHAWSYLLAHLRHGIDNPVRLNEIRRQVATYLIDTAQLPELR